MDSIDSIDSIDSMVSLVAWHRCNRHRLGRRRGRACAGGQLERSVGQPTMQYQFQFSVQNPLNSIQNSIVIGHSHCCDRACAGGQLNRSDIDSIDSMDSIDSIDSMVSL